MPENIDPKLVDKRTLERYLRLGQLDEKNYERFIKNLPDVADKAIMVETNMGGDQPPASPPSDNQP
jgi:hypothetical protein